MTDKIDNPGTSDEVHGASVNVLADTPDNTEKDDFEQEVDELIDKLIERSAGFEPNWTDTDIDLTAEPPPHMVFTPPQAMLDEALSLEPDLAEKLQIGLVKKYVRTHGNPHGWADDDNYIQGVVNAVKDERDPTQRLYEVKPKGLIKRPTPPPVTSEGLFDFSTPDYDLDPSTPWETANRYLVENFRDENKFTLVRYGGEFYTWDGTHYSKVEIELIEAELYRFLEGRSYKRKGEIKSYNPDQAKVSRVVNALKSAVQLHAEVQAPCWLDDTVYPPACEFIACNNGLLHLPTRKLRDHIPTFLTHNALPYEFDNRAPEPVEFFKFLDSIFVDDAEARDLLQEMFGYIVSGATSLQKILMIVGPRRAGKGVIGRLLVSLVGKANTCSPSLGSFASNFPLQPLIGKTLALMSDARLDGQINQKSIVEHMLRVSGEDDVNVARKNRTDWSGRLPTRFMLLSNEVPQLADASGALAGRFVTLVLTESFHGKEDLTLTERLLQELPGILNWALDGRDRLQQQGRFTTPASSKEVMTELENLSSPILKFIDDRCVLGADKTVRADDLYRAWTETCRQDGQHRVITNATFGRDLWAAVPSLKKTRPHSKGVRPTFYAGIDLREIPPVRVPISIARNKKGDD